MLYVNLKKLWLLPVLSSFFAETLSIPAWSSLQYVEKSRGKRQSHNLNVVETTETHSNTLDWIQVSSQGKIAKAPPLPPALPQDPNRKTSRPISELEMPGIKKGPAGTVPIPRVNPTYRNSDCQKKPPPEQPGITRRQDAGVHWYINSDQKVDNHGSGFGVSLFAPFVNNTGDFSLLQTAVTANTSAGMQTVEAGWIVFPDQVSQPHIFTFFTTNGYTSDGNNISGWNRNVTGWVQVDSTYFPGTVFSSLSTINGTQYDIAMQYQLYEGNWWLQVIDRYVFMFRYLLKQDQQYRVRTIMRLYTDHNYSFIGYYPGSLFSAATRGGPSLANKSDTIYFYGEVAQSENEGPPTNSDMGSGEFAQTGFGYSAYMRNM